MTFKNFSRGLKQKCASYFNTDLQAIFFLPSTYIFFRMLLTLPKKSLEKNLLSDFKKG